MAKQNKWKSREGVVFSTNPDFQYESTNPSEEQTLPPARQQLRVSLDRSGRAGKTVTLVSGFVGSLSDMESLAKQLKAHCGTGGSVKDGLILIQGDVRDKVVAWLVQKGYPAKKTGG